MSKQEQKASEEKDEEEDIPLTYQLRKIFHLIQLQTLDLESTLQYIQKKHTLNQLKEALSHAYSIFNESEPLFKYLRAMFMQSHLKKLFNCFGIIYVILMDHVEKSGTNKFTINKEESQKQEEKHQPISANCQAQQKTQIKPIPNQDHIQKKPKKNAFGGIHLYNQNYMRYVEEDADKIRRKQKRQNREENKKISEKEKFKEDVLKDINTNYSLEIGVAEDLLDIFSFQMKNGRETQVVTFHEELESIAEFFKQSQDQAFQFLNKTKDQSLYISYTESFREVENTFKIEKQEKINVFMDKMKEAFTSIKNKSESKMLDIEKKLVELAILQKSLAKKPKKNMETQTSHNFQEEILNLSKKIRQLQQKYTILSEYEKEENIKRDNVYLQINQELILKKRQVLVLHKTLNDKNAQIQMLLKKIKTFAFRGSTNISELGSLLNLPFGNDQKMQNYRLNSKMTESESASNYQQKNKFEKDHDSMSQDLNNDFFNLDQAKIQKKLMKLQKMEQVQVSSKVKYTKRFTELQSNENKYKNRQNQLSLISEHHKDQYQYGDDNSSVVETTKFPQRFRSEIKANAQVSHLSKEKRLTNINAHDQLNALKNYNEGQHRFSTSKDSQSRSKNRLDTHRSQAKSVIKEDQNSELNSSEYNTEHQNISQNQIPMDESNSKSKRIAKHLKHLSQLDDYDPNYTSINLAYQKGINTNKKSINKKFVLKQNTPEITMKNIKSPQSKKQFKSHQQSYQKNVPVKSQYYVEKNGEIDQDSQKLLQQQEDLDEQWQENCRICSKQINLIIDHGIIAQSIQKLKQMSINKQLKLTTFQKDLYKQSMTANGIKKSNKTSQSESFTESRHPSENNIKISHKNETYNRYNSTVLGKISFNKNNLQKIGAELNSTNKNNQKTLGEFKEIKDSSMSILQSIEKENQLNKKHMNTFEICEEFAGENSQNSQEQHQMTMILNNSRKQGNQQKTLKTPEEEIESNEIESRLENEIIRLARRSKNMEEFRLKVMKFHVRSCGESCQHLQRYLDNFIKYKNQSKEVMKLNIENVNSHILENKNGVNQNTSLPNIFKKKI